jgi:hypothetical protein
MSLARKGIVLALVIAMVPSDKGAQQKLYLQAVDTFNQAATYCDRHPDVCAKAAKHWASFRDKAEFVGQLAVDAILAYAREQLDGTGTAAAPGPGTLTRDDLKPAWRLSARRDGT